MVRHRFKKRLAESFYGRFLQKQVGEANDRIEIRGPEARAWSGQMSMAGAIALCGATTDARSAAEVDAHREMADRGDLQRKPQRHYLMRKLRVQCGSRLQKGCNGGTEIQTGVQQAHHQQLVTPQFAQNRREESCHSHARLARGLWPSSVHTPRVGPARWAGTSVLPSHRR